MNTLSKEEIFRKIYNDFLASKKELYVISIAGLSRSGKSIFSKELSNFLNKKKINNEILNLDSWIIDINKRKCNSTVLERYEMNEIENAILKLVSGVLVECPFYDTYSRKRIKNRFSKVIQISKGVLIIEGVVSLTRKSFFRYSDFKIFIQINDILRTKRLIEFYRDLKNLSKKDYKKIIIDRDEEEKKTIINSKINANYILSL